MLTLDASSAAHAGLAQFAVQQGMTTPIEFIFDEQQGVDADIGLFFSELKKNLSIDAQRLGHGPDLLCISRRENILDGHVEHVARRQPEIGQVRR